MTVINNKNISGITSINAQSNSLELFNSAGVSLLDLNTNSVTFPGNVAIGGIVPDTLLHLQGDQPKLRIESTNSLDASGSLGTEEIARIEFEATKSTNRNVAASMRVRQDGTWSTVDDWFSPTAIEFYTQDQSGTEVTTPRFTINRDGNIGIGTDIPAETLSVAGNVRVENSADASQYLTIDYQGLNFQNTGAGSSTTSSAHLLDDYEEGTWTPGVEGLVTPGTYTISTAVGTYTKIGNQVTIVGRMDTITETVAGSSSVQITGLPFASATNAVYSIGTIELSNWNIDNATNSLNCFALNNAVKLYIRETRDGLAITNVNLADLISGSSIIRLTMTYLVD